MIYKLSLVVLLATTTACFVGCSDQFLQDKKPYGSFGTSTIYGGYEGAKGRVDFLYYAMAPRPTEKINPDYPSTGVDDDYSKSTEEYAGFSDYVNPNIILTYSSVPDYIYKENKNISPYGRIRECNDVIEGISKSDGLSEEEKKELLGQAYFFRAWRYYLLVRIYGGVPIIDYVQNPIVGDNGGESLVVPRATTKECIDFMCNDLKIASEYLPATWAKGAADFGRVTSGTALALQGRIRLLYASPLFNRKDNADRWELAYESNKAAVITLEGSGRFGLAYENNPGINATGWAKMFSSYTGSDNNGISEAVFVRLHNTLTNSSDYKQTNGWEQGIRPVNAYGTGGKTVTSNMVDLFPMADGKRPGESVYPYVERLFFQNRDPRFYQTFAFPGVRWAFNGDPTSLDPSGFLYPYSGVNYELWSYCWYKPEDTEVIDNDDESGYAADGLGNKNNSVYLRKRSDDLDLNSTPLYEYMTTTTDKGFTRSAAPYMEMRFAEVLLNFAESACGAGHYEEAWNALTRIRKRVGYTEENNFGLDPAIKNDRARLMKAILYERQVELAYEGKRFDDMRRWMLWDGGLKQETLNADWKLSGFGGNTCKWLDVEPLNGQRRRNIEIYTTKTAKEEDKSDPLKEKDGDGIALYPRPKALKLTTDVTTLDLEEPDQNSNIYKLGAFYGEHLLRKNKRADGDVTKTVTFLPKYYLIGFKDNMMINNVTLHQTIGWYDRNTSSDGTYDPLAE